MVFYTYVGHALIMWLMRYYCAITSTSFFLMNK